MMCILELCVRAASFAPCYSSTASNAHASLAGVIRRRRQHHRSVPHVHCSSQRRDRLFRRPRRLAFCFCLSRPTPPPPPPPEWMDPDVHRRWASPAACCCALCSRGCHRSSCRTSRGFKIIERFRRWFRVSRCAHFALPLVVTWRFHALCFQPRRRGTKQVAAAPSSVALESSFTRQSSEANRMSLSQALQVPLCPLC